MLDEKPARVNDISTGQYNLDYWVTGQRVLSDLHFLNRIRTFPRDGVSNRTIDIIRTYKLYTNSLLKYLCRKYVQSEAFDPSKVKQASLAAEGMSSSSFF